MRGGRRAVLALATLASAYCVVSAGAQNPALAAGFEPQQANALGSRPAAAVLGSQPAVDALGPRPVTAVLREVDAEDQQWVSVRWRTGEKVCDFRLALWGNSNIDVDYPASRNYTSFSRGGTLSPGHTDYTSFLVTPHYDRQVWALLAATIKYDHCGRHARTMSRSSSLLLPVRG